MVYRIFVTVSVSFIFLVLAFAEAEDPLKKAEVLMVDGKFYEALFALEPLLTTEEKSVDQEEALWLANALCRTWVSTDDFDKRWKKEKQTNNKPELEYSNGFMQWDKVITLNEWGARIIYEHFNARPAYAYGFLERLVKLYPDSSWRPAAEYYLIEDGHNEREPVEKSLNTCYAYIKKYEKSGLIEVCMAYLRVAYVNDNLWQALKSPESEYNRWFTSGNPETDKADAAKHKAEALKYYAKFIVSVGGDSYDYVFSFKSQEAVKRFEDLKQDKEWHNWYIILD